MLTSLQTFTFDFCAIYQVLFIHSWLKINASSRLPNTSTRYTARSTVYDRQQQGATIGQPTRFDMHKLAMLIQVFPPITFLQKLFRFFTTFVETSDHDYDSLQVFPDGLLTGLVGGRENPA